MRQGSTPLRQQPGNVTGLECAAVQTPRGRVPCSESGEMFAQSTFMCDILANSQPRGGNPNTEVEMYPFFARVPCCAVGPCCCPHTATSWQSTLQQPWRCAVHRSLIFPLEMTLFGLSMLCPQGSLRNSGCARHRYCVKTALQHLYYPQNRAQSTDTVMPSPVHNRFTAFALAPQPCAPWNTPWRSPLPLLSHNHRRCVVWPSLTSPGSRPCSRSWTGSVT